LTNTDKLIEIVEYAEETEIPWLDLFDSPSEALKIIRGALKEDPDENQIISLLTALNLYDNFFESCTIDIVYKDTLNSMIEELEELES